MHLRTPMGRARTSFAAAFVVTIACALPGAAQAAEPDPPPQPIQADRFHLAFTPKNPALIAQRERALAGRQVPVDKIGTDRNTRDCPKKTLEAVAPLTARDNQVVLRCWNGNDSHNEWTPQGVTGTADASPDNRYNGIQALAVTSYHRRSNQARVTLLPGATPTGYRQIRLVEAVAAGKAQPITCHTGGAVWYGNYLLVACTNWIAVFDWRKVYHPAGDPFEILQVGTLDTSQRVRFSSLSLDRSVVPPRLVAAEYQQNCASNNCRVIRFALPTQPDDLPAHRTRNPIRATDAHRHSYDSTQGVASRGDNFWFAASGGPAKNDPISHHYGKLHTWRTGTRQARHYEWAYGAESITIANRADGSAAITTVTEWSGYRVIATVNAVRFP